MVDRHMYPVRVIQETAQLITGVCVCVCVGVRRGGGWGRKQALVLVHIIRNMSIMLTPPGLVHTHTKISSRS